MEKLIVNKSLLIIFVLTLLIMTSCGTTDTIQNHKNDGLEGYRVDLTGEPLSKYIESNGIIKMDKEELKRSGQFSEEEIESGKLEQTYMTFTFVNSEDWNQFSIEDQSAIAETTVDYCLYEMDKKDYPGSCIIECKTGTDRIFEWNNSLGLRIIETEYSGNMKKENVIKEYKYKMD